jgi:L-histidine N-alpha-methyltransferase
MRLHSDSDQRVPVADLDLDLQLAGGEEILTEISTKFDPGALPGELASSGLDRRAAWSDPDGDFLLSLAAPAPI